MFSASIFEYYIIVTALLVVIAIVSNAYYYLSVKWKLYECPNGGWVVDYKGHKLVELDNKLQLVYIPHNLDCDSYYGTWSTIKEAEYAIEKFESLTRRQPLC